MRRHADTGVPGSGHRWYPYGLAIVWTVAIAVSLGCDIAPFGRSQATTGSPYGESESVTHDAEAYAVLWLLGVGGIALGARHTGLMERERIQALEALSAADERLARHDRLKSLFIAGMGHELRTPLNYIIGFTDMMLNGASGAINEEQAKQLTMVVGGARHLLSILNDVMEVSGAEASEATPTVAEFDLVQTLSELRDLFGLVAANRGIGLSLEVPATLVIESDERRVKQIAMNLIDNALKFTDEGGVVVSARRTSDDIEVSVSDSGSGIPPDDIDVVFEPFRRSSVPARDDRGGSGLGLYLSSRMAAALGGGITVSSTPGSGSTFTLALPSTSAEASA